MRQHPSGSTSRRPRTGKRNVARVGIAVSAVLLATTTAGSSSAQSPGTVSSTTTAAQPPVATSNPLAGRKWGVYKGNREQSWKPYTRSSGANRKLLAKIALRPKAAWFGKWISNADVEKKVREYIASSTGGDPSVLVQMTVFRMVPWEHDACKRLPTDAERASYRQWTRRFAAGIGSAHVALILQPDGPFALCAPGGSRLPSRVIGYAAKKFSALPNTSVYIDAGASDWPAGKPAEAARILMPAGVQYARGFALNATHYSSTDANIAFGASVVNELARQGVPGKHFVINTSSNGRPFTFGQAPGSDPDNATVCRTRTQTRCVTLGIPPTNQVARARWGLTTQDRALATQDVDGYLWFGRPWLYNQANPYLLKRALALTRTTPY